MAQTLPRDTFFSRTHLQPMSTLMSQALWFTGGAVGAFVIPYVFSDLLDLQHDLYYLVYFLSVGTFLGVYSAATGVRWGEVIRRHWLLGGGVGVLTTAFVVFGVFREDGTPHPDGAYFGFELLWRGLLYGAVDALALSVFPGLVAYALLHGDIGSIGRRAGFLLATLLLSVIITTTYHFGYEQFRDYGFSYDGVGGPVIGNTVMSLPMAVSANPVGSVVSHAAMHVAATTHAYETDLYLPPQTGVNEDGSAEQ